jgi:hypothetical protein
LVAGNEPLFNDEIAVAAARPHRPADADSPLRLCDGYPFAGCLDMCVVRHMRLKFICGQPDRDLEIRRSHDDLARVLLPPARVEPRFEPRFA